MSVCIIFIGALRFIAQEKRIHDTELDLLKQAVKTRVVKDFQDDPTVCFDAKRLEANIWSVCAQQKDEACLERLKTMIAWYAGKES